MPKRNYQDGGLLDKAKKFASDAEDEFKRGVRMVGRDLGVLEPDEAYIPKERLVVSPDKKHFAGTDTQGNLRVGSVKTKDGMKKGGKVRATASSRADGIAKRGRTKGKLC